jgi:hypothetical protein
MKKSTAPSSRHKSGGRAKACKNSKLFFAGFWYNRARRRNERPNGEGVFMPAHVVSNGVTLGNENVLLAEFHKLVEKHLRRYPDTPDLETEGSRLRSADFEEQQLESFIRRVCTWGGYPGIGGRTVNQNSKAKIGMCFRSAMAKLESDIPNISGALYEVNRIRSLGKPSFASKHLRFLRPDICPILDSIVSDRLNYPFTIYGYQALASDCAKIAVSLQDNQITNPRHREGNRWYISDVEMAIFSYLNKL